MNTLVKVGSLGNYNNFKYKLVWTCSSVGQSSGLISRRSLVQAQAGPRCIKYGRALYIFKGRMEMIN